MAKRVCVSVLLLLVVVFSNSSADECAPDPLNEYPVCLPLYHNITVSEGLKKNSAVLQLNCSDPEGSELTWQIAEGNVKKTFGVTDTGQLQVIKKLDAEGTINPYLLFVEAADEGEPQMTTTVVITVFVSSLNDEAPLMLGIPESVEVSENSGQGDLVFQCSLVDQDTAKLPEGGVRVRIVEGNEDDLFRLDSRTCALMVNKRLDFETLEEPIRRLLLEAYELDVAAYLTSAKNVTITITDYNDHPPNCSENVILLTVSEDAESGTVLASLNCSDIDVSDTLRYGISPDSKERYFVLADSTDALAVNETSGEVTIAQPLDYETGSNYDVIVLVYDVSSEPLTTTVIINVQLLDVDDSVPQFESDVIHIDVEERWEVGRVVWTLTARDEDTPGTPLSTVTYTALPPSQEDWFHVHSATGAVTIREVLDRERSPIVLLTMTAYSSDRHTATSTVLLNISITDYNDNRPAFNQTWYHATMKEGSVSGTPVCDVMAFDADGADVIFSSDSDTFAVDSTTGGIVLMGPLDLENRTSYTFVVTATDDDDSNMTSQALVWVEVEGRNEAPPTFQVPAGDSEVRFVSEDAAPGTKLFSVSASDADEGDDGRVTYHIQPLPPPSSSSSFLVDVLSGDVTLSSRLDRETRDTYVLVLEARDSSPSDPKTSSVTLIVNVTDVDDSGPVCQPVAPVLVKDSAPVGGPPLLTLRCSDPDLDDPSGTTFVKVSGDASGVFGVDAESGEVRLTRVPTLPEYEVTFQVRDASSSTGFSAYVTVVFLIESTFSFSDLPAVVEIREDVEVGAMVLELETSGSRLPSYFELGDAGDAFVIQPASGEVYLAGALDRETRDTYVLTVVASTASGHAATGTVTVSVLDVNDHAPVIVGGAFNISVVEGGDDSALPATLTVFSARDADADQNGAVSFEIRSGNDGGRFSLSSDGVLRVVQPLDVETQPLYRLMVRVTDGGSPPLSSENTVIVRVVNVDEFQPQFAHAGQNLIVSIPEDTAVGALVVHVTADDADLTDDVRFDLIGGDGEDTFRVDRITGRVFLAKLLDREERPELDVVVKVSNAKQENQTSVITVTVEDANDNAPTFSRPQYMYDVTDNTPANTLVGDLSVFDRDAGTNADFHLQVLSGDAGVFRLEGLRLVTNQTVNISDAGSYRLTIRATDEESPALWTDVDVFVRVIPENRPPRFLTHQANISVEENSLTGLRIYDFQATGAGATEGESGDLVYSLASGSEDLPFHVDGFTGELYVIRDLDYEENPTYRLSVRAQHRGDQDLFDVMDFAIYVINVNDVSPAFDRLTYTWWLEEGVHEGRVLGAVRARDEDAGPFGQVSYSLSSDAMFAISATSGEVTVTGHVDYHQHSYFFLSVTATDQAGPASLTGRAAIMVHVVDVNDHVPEFPDMNREVKVPESTPIGSVVAPLSPRDDDSGDNGRLTCEIVSGNRDGAFSVDPDTCVVTVSSSLDAESEQTRYELAVRVTDAGSPALTATTSLTIDVTDDNDNWPTFQNSTAHVQLVRSVQSGTLVFQAVAWDADSGRNGMILYSFLLPDKANAGGGGGSGSGGGAFSVQPVTGQVRTLGSLTLAGDRHTLLLAATDRGYPARTGTLTLTVDIFPPLLPSSAPAEHEFEIPELSRVGTVVGVLPSGGDGGSSSSSSGSVVVSRAITSGNYRNAFRVSTRQNGDGVVEVAGPTDRETYPEYQLVVETRSRDVSTGAVDVVLTASTVVKIELSDVNDHAPVFADPALAFSVVENLPAGTTVARLDVSDGDAGMNAEVKLSLAAVGGWGLCEAHFALTSDGGVVIREPLDYESLIVLTCKVLAEDSGVHPRRSTAAFTATVLDIPDEDVEYVVGEDASSVFVSLEIPFDSSSGRVVHTLTALQFGAPPSPAGNESVSFISLSPDGVFTIAPETGEVRLARQDLLHDKSRYFQWVACRHWGGGGGVGVVSTQLGMLRVDAFSADRHVVVLSVDAGAEYVQSKRSMLRSRLQTFFGARARLEVLEIRDDQGTNARRRLLDVESVALVYVVRDTSADGVGGVDRDKIFLTQEEILKVIQSSPEGAPVEGVSDSTLPVAMVMAYHGTGPRDADDPQDFIRTAEGLALVLVLIGLFVFIVVFLFVCFLRHLHKKKRRVRKDSMSLLKNDAMSDRDQTTPPTTPPPVAQKEKEADEVSLISEAEDSLPLPPNQNQKGRRMTLVIKEELDRMYSLPTMLAKRPTAEMILAATTTTSIPGSIPPTATTSASTTTSIHGADTSPSVVQEKQQALNRMIREKRARRRKKMLLKGKLSGKVAQSPGMESFPMPENSYAMQKGGTVEGEVDHSQTQPHPEVETSSPVLTARSVHLHHQEAWVTSSSARDSEKTQSTERSTQDNPRPTSGRLGIFSSVFESRGRKRSIRSELATKRASMPAAISTRETIRLSNMAAAATGQQAYKTAGAQLSSTNEQDIGQFHLKDGLVVSHPDRPEDTRRQSLFV